jgi:uncharacterized protein (TIGR03435 family)
MRLALVTSLILSVAFTGYGPLSGLEKQPAVFEAATIKLNRSGSRSSDSTTRNGHLIATNISLKSLMQYEAYGIPGSRILGGPKWLDSTRFDVEAKMDDSTADRLQALPHSERRIEEQAMVQQLLADRFKLAVHRETRELPVYALVAAKKGPKLQPSKTTAEGSHTSSTGTRSGLQLTAEGVSLPQFADALTQRLFLELGRDVVDRTEIKGRFDITLKWMPNSEIARNQTDGPSASADDNPAIFTAIQEQLGLKLEPAKAPIEVIVIDHAEMPSDN